jgi:hypothetical protein
MNERIQKLWVESTGAESPTNDFQAVKGEELEKFAELIIQECANYIRENYDSWDAEPLAHNLEVDFGLHGDYAE